LAQVEQQVQEVLPHHQEVMVLHLLQHSQLEQLVLLVEVEEELVQLEQVLVVLVVLVEVVLVHHHQEELV
jgi:hypothetical protein